MTCMLRNVGLGELTYRPAIPGHISVTGFNICSQQKGTGHFTNEVRTIFGMVRAQLLLYA
jgi:hypothetical protein